MKKVIILFSIIFILSGCWNYQELNDYAIATGMAIDYDKQKEEYEVSLLIANGNKNEEESAQISILSGKGKNLYEAIKDISLLSPKEIYLSHLSIVIFSEEVSKKGLNNVLDFLMREPQSHQNFYIINAKNSKAKDVLSILTPLSDYPSQGITSNVKVTEKLQGKITNANFNHFIGKILEDGINPVINSIKIIGDEKDGTKKEEQQNSIMKANTKLDTIGIFKNDKLVDWATEEESIGINMLLGDVDILYLTIPCDKGNTVIVANSFKLKNTVNKDKIESSIIASGKINETTCNIDIRDENEIKALEEKVEKEMINYMQQAIDIAKENNSDIFGYGSILHKNDYKYFDSIKDWDNYFVQKPIKLNADFNITEKGSLEQSLKEQKNEK